jgi:hypothetical protein
VPPSAQFDDMAGWVKQLNISQGMTALDFTLGVALTTDQPAHASAFSGLIRMGLLAAQTGLSHEAAKQTPKHKDYAKTQSALAVLKTFVNRTDGNTLHLSVSVPQKTVAELVRQEWPKKPAPTTTTKPTRRRTRPRKG